MLLFLLYEALTSDNDVQFFFRYIMSSHVRRLGHFSSAVHIYGVMLGFFTVNYKDVS